MRIFFFFFMFIFSATFLEGQQCYTIMNYGKPLEKCEYTINSDATMTFMGCSYLQELVSEDDCAEIIILFKNGTKIQYNGFINKNFIIDFYIVNNEKRYISYEDKIWSVFNNEISKINIKTNLPLKIGILNDNRCTEVKYNPN